MLLPRWLLTLAVILSILSVIAARPVSKIHVGEDATHGIEVAVAAESIRSRRKRAVVKKPGKVTKTENDDKVDKDYKDDKKEEVHNKTKETKEKGKEEKEDEDKTIIEELAVLKLREEDLDRNKTIEEKEEMAEVLTGVDAAHKRIKREAKPKKQRKERRKRTMTFDDSTTDSDCSDQELEKQIVRIRHRPGFQTKEYPVHLALVVNR